MSRHPASEAQIRAADPGISTWLSANAGSGKTRVLIQRVVRLLFAGTPPQRILCLTFTKAAAAEMQNRLFQLLGGWAMLEAGALRTALRELGIEDRIGQDELLAARRLFAQAIETPGGLRILTIHSFCSSLLRRFPLEARVSPDFTEIDETTTAMLQTDVLEQMSDDASVGLIDSVALAYRSEDWSPLIGSICKNRAFFETELDRASICTAVGISPDLTIDDLVTEVLEQSGGATISALVPLLESGSSTEKTAAGTLARFKVGDVGHYGLSVLEDGFLTAEGLVRKAGFPTAPTRKGMDPHFVASLDALIERVAAARPVRLALAAADRTESLHRFAREFLQRYDAAKSARAWMDFDDLILKAEALLSDHSVAQWVLYRLDGGIDHILVDEAQDTGPGQWAVIARLAEEFSFSRGSRGEERTVFVVGDKKQSIYSFQGADLQTFDRMEADFRERYAPRELWQTVSLDYSFRSSPAILRVVDATFDARVNRGLGGDPEHLAFFEDMPGRVDVWPVLDDSDQKEETDYFTPEFIPTPQKANQRLATQIARQIARMIAEGTPVRGDNPGSFRPAHAGDFLILVRQRQTPLFNAIIRACKAAKLDVAGADRLKLAAEIAVNDLVLLLRFLALPEDDLSLAGVLRSPLFGWSDRQLFQLAARRPDKGLLWAALRNAQGDAADTVAVLDDLRTRAEFLRPFDLLERALTTHEMRKRLLERLGPEAEDGIDELLTQALLYEQIEVPNLTGFLLRMEAATGDIKRQTQQGARAIRVMTVHGAKGLEAPIVILPDTIAPRRPKEPEVFVDTNGTALWRTNKATTPPAIAALKHDAAALEEQERMRLLYVAMTRAESWLIVAAAGKVKDDDTGWYALVRAGAIRAGTAAVDVDGIGTILRHEFGTWPKLEADRVAVADKGFHDPLPKWLIDRPDPVRARPKPMSPSALPGSKALPGDGGQDPAVATRYGTLLHLVLQHMPRHAPDGRRRMAEGLLMSLEEPVTAAEIAVIIADAERVLNAPGLSAVLAEDALVEVEITGEIPSLPGRRLHGAIDRLLVSDVHVVAIDYKSNTIVPQRAEDVPDGILRQMGAYAELLQQIYPDREIEMAIIWTATAQYMPLPCDILRSAMTSAPSLDDAPWPP